MREILFRGKYHGKWVYGGYSELHGIVRVSDALIVNPDTVSQYTGLDDKNGHQIFEGDIVNVADAERTCRGAIKFGKYEFNEYGFYIGWASSYTVLKSGLAFNLYTRDVEVIGNIWDTPELLEEVHNETR